MRYTAPVITDYGSISDHTFMPTPPTGMFTKSHKGEITCRVETANCELSSNGEPTVGVPLS